MTIVRESATVTNTPAQLLHDRIAARTAVIGIVGLGYVGLPLAKAVHDAGFGVIGFDVDDTKIAALARGESYLRHLGGDLVGTLSGSDRFRATSDAADLHEADILILCVPTPLGTHREPDLSYVLDSTRMVAGILRLGQLVILESTTYPGTTRDDMLPILAETGLTCGEEYFLAYSPEREDPGRAGTTTASIPKLVGGVDPRSGDLAEQFYRTCIRQVHRVSTAEVAEAAKLLENIYRAVNIALVNELKTVLADMGIDIWEVIAAAATKPFGFQAFYPGPGLGGHCIPIDPFYLTWKAKELGRPTKFIELAGEINAHMPMYVISRIIGTLNEEGRALRGSKILVIGLAYKPDVDDTRETPAAEIIDLLEAGGADVAYHDPHVPVFPRMRHYRKDLQSQPLSDAFVAAHDLVVIVTDHRAIDWTLLGRHARIIVDTRNAMARATDPTARIVKA